MRLPDDIAFENTQLPRDSILTIVNFLRVRLVPGRIDSAAAFGRLYAKHVTGDVSELWDPGVALADLATQRGDVVVGHQRADVADDVQVGVPVVLVGGLVRAVGDSLVDGMVEDVDVLAESEDHERPESSANPTKSSFRGHKHGEVRPDDPSLNRPETSNC